MNLTFFQGLLMGFVSGLAELLPLSSAAHRGFLRLCFGVQSEGALFILLCHLATFCVVAVGLRPELSRLRRASKLMRSGSGRRRQQPDQTSAATVRHLRSAVLITVVARLFSRQTAFLADRLYLLCGALLISGVLLWLPNVLRSGNKDGRNMLRMDSLLMGFAAALSVFPGISLVGAAASVGIARGVDKGYALRFSLILLLSALGVDLALDVLALLSSGAMPGMMGVVCAVAGAAFCALGSWIGLQIMRAQARSIGFTVWSYYAWGMALLCLMLFLIL